MYIKISKHVEDIISDTGHSEPFWPEILFEISSIKIKVEELFQKSIGIHSHLITIEPRKAKSVYISGEMHEIFDTRIEYFLISELTTDSIMTSICRVLLKVIILH